MDEEAQPRSPGWRGLLPGVPIAYDDFNYPPEKQPAFYILSHIHADHIQGLHSKWKGAPIYCTPLTKKILLQKYPALDLGVIAIPYDRPQMVPVGSEQVCIEFWDAHHCAGSACTLLVGYFGSFLLSGDFRFLPSMRKQMISRLRHRTQPIDLLMLDCTFSDPHWVFPLPTAAIQQVIQLIQRHPDDAQVYLESEMLGLEPLLVVLAKRFRTKIHVDQRKWHSVQCLPGVAKYLTTEESQSRIHVCPFKTFTHHQKKRNNTTILPCDKSRKATTQPKEEWKWDEEKLLFIKPSTMWFGTNRRQVPDLTPFQTTPARENFVWHVLYSIHSSYEELMSFVQLVKPCHILPWTECSSSTLEEMNQRYCSEYTSSTITIPSSVVSAYPYLRTQAGGPFTVLIGEDQNVAAPSEGEEEVSCWSPDESCSEEEITPMPFPAKRSLEEEESTEDQDCIIVDRPPSPKKRKSDSSGTRVGW